MNRRTFLAGVTGAIATAAAAGGGVTIARARAAHARTTLRVGVMTNLTHAPLLAGLGSGRIAQAIAPVAVDTRVFRAGPRVTEALLGGAIDVGTAGPAAVVVHHARHKPHGLRILGGCCSGGASLVVTRASAIGSAADLRGKRLAVTQIGTTQDIALRMFLREAGLRDATAGGDVTVLAIAGATILHQMRRGDLHGAWLPEPWATRVVNDVGAVRLVDERDLWPARRFSTAVLVTRRAAAAEQEPLVEEFARALASEVDRALTHPDATLAEAHAELKRRVGNAGPFSIFAAAAAFVDFTRDPLRASIERFGDAAAAFGLCPPHPTDGLFST